MAKHKTQNYCGKEEFLFFSLLKVQIQKEQNQKEKDHITWVNKLLHFLKTDAHNFAGLSELR